MTKYNLFNKRGDRTHYEALGKGLTEHFKSGAEYVKNSRFGNAVKYVHDSNMELLGFAKEGIKNTAKDISYTIREMKSGSSHGSGKSKSNEHSAHDFVGAYSGLMAGAVEASATIPILERINKLPYSVVSMNGRLYDVINKRFLDGLETVGYGIAKNYPQLPFILWVGAAVATTAAVGLTARHISKKISKKILDE